MRAGCMLCNSCFVRLSRAGLSVCGMRRRTRSLDAVVVSSNSLLLRFYPPSRVFLVRARVGFGLAGRFRVCKHMQGGR
ncbi:hypothetical protein R3P38DRAFT_3120460 [Favolaschia claudopus]|uniref:Secreted protein n=1 Tax=Favolaschia claudopus TaxID=2862362 RepID=A0AAV9ZDB2_9AGAR